MQLQLYGKKIWFYRQPIDFRCAIDGLVGLISSELKQKPKSLLNIMKRGPRFKGPNEALFYI